MSSISLKYKRGGGGDNTFICHILLFLRGLSYVIQKEIVEVQ